MNAQQTPEPLAEDETNDPTEVGDKRIPGKSWEYTAAVLKRSAEQIAEQLADEREYNAALVLECMNLREQLSRANRTIDTLTNRSN